MDNIAIATVVAVVGKAYARNADGELRELRPGDTLMEGETVVTPDGGSVELSMSDGSPLVISDMPEMTLTADLVAQTASTREESEVTDETIDDVLAALESGEDLGDVLAATAAGGAGGGGGGEGSSFIRLGRIVEGVDEFHGVLPTWGIDDANPENDPLQPVDAIDDVANSDGEPVTILVKGNDEFPEGELIASFTQPANGSVVLNSDGSFTYTPDEGFDGTDTFTYVGINPAGNAEDEATVTIVVDQPPAPEPEPEPEPLPLLSIGDAVVQEGDTAVVTISLSAPSDQVITVKVDTFDRTATAVSGDYDPDSETVTFNPGETEVTISIPTNVDDIQEGTEFLVADLTDPVNAEIHDGEGIVEIIDNFTPTISIGDDTVVEGDTATVTVSLSAPVDEEVTVSFNTANGSATVGNDYNAATGTITFAPGQTSTTVSVTTIGDTVVENNENLFVNLSNADGATILDGQGEIIILDDDVPPPPPPPPANNPPDAVNDGFSTEVNTPVSGNVLPNDSDPDNDPLTVTGNTQPANGTVVVNPDGSFTYTPGEDFDGSDSFQYTITDGEGGSDTATVNLTVTDQPIDLLPSVRGIQSEFPEAQLPGGSAENPTALSKDGVFTVTAADGLDTLVINDVEVIAGGAVTGTNVVTDTGVQVTINSVTPGADGIYEIAYTATLISRFQHDADSDAKLVAFEIEVTDTDGDSASAVRSATIIDDSPTGQSDANAIPAEEFGPVGGNVVTNDTLGADTAVVVGVAVGDTGATLDDPNSLGTITGLYGELTLSSDGTYTYSRNEESPGDVEDVFTYTLKDADGDLSATTLTISIGDAPVTLDLPVEGEAGTAVDEAGLPARGSEPAGSDAASDSETTASTFFYTAPDGPAVITIGGVAVATVGQTFDGTSGTLTITSINPGAIGYSYTLTDNTSGDAASDSFAVVVTDDDGDVASGDLVLTIADDVVTARADTDSLINSDTAVAGNVIDGTSEAGIGAADTEGADGALVTSIGTGSDTLDVNGAVVIDGVHGQLTINPDGSYAYSLSQEGLATQAELDEGESVTDVFTYGLTDSDLDVSSADLTISINGSDAPFVVANDTDAFSESAVEGGTPVTGATNVLANDSSDPDTNDNPVTVVGATVDAVSTDGNNTVLGTIVFATDGSYTLALNEAGQAAANALDDGESFDVAADYTATNVDDPAQTETATLTITINGVDDEFTVANDTDSFSESAVEGGTPVTGATNVLTNDSDDPDTNDNPVTVVGATVDAVSTDGNNTVLGTIVFATDGSYTLELNEAGQAAANALDDGESFDVAADYTATNVDDPAQTETATLTITINGVDDEFTVANDTDSFSESAVEGGTPVTGATNVLTNDSDDPDTNDNPVTVVGATVDAVSTDGNNTVLGTIVFATDGSYTLELNEAGQAAANALDDGESFDVAADYTATNVDNPAQTETATLTITINGVDDAFIARDDVDSFTETAVEGGIEVAGNINVLTTAPGVDGPDPDTTDNPIKVQVAEDVAALSTADNVQLGWIDFAADGTYTLQLNEEGKARANALNNGETLQVKADYTAENSGVPSQTDVATLTITINGVDDAFIARDDVDSFTETAVEGGIEVAGNINVLTTAPGVDGPDPDTTDNPIKVQVAEDVAALSTADNVQLGWIDFAADGTYTLQLNEEGKARANALNNGETLQVKADYTAENSGVPSQTDVATLTITINGVDDAFIARDDVDSFTETAVEGGIEVAGNINVLTTAPGVDGPDPDTTDNPIKVQVAEDVAALSTADNVQLGWIDFAADGTYTLQLNEEGKARANALNNGETLQVKADYTAENSGVPSQTDVATLTITINGVDDAFIARDDVDSFTETAVEGGIEVAGNINVLTTAPGVDGPDPDTTDNPIKVQVAEDVAALSTADNVQLGWIDFAADGTYTLQLNEEGKARANALNNGETLQVKADYTAENSGVPSQTDVATLTITINGVDDAFIARDDVDSFTETAVEGGIEVAGNINVLTTAPGVDGPDPDTTDNPIKVQVAEDVAALSTADNVQLGWIDFAADGTYTLQLNEEGKARANALNNGETLQVKADYTAENSGVPSQTDVATLTITINGVDDAFIARDDVDSFTETAVEGGIEVAGNINVLTTAPGVDGPDPDTTDNPIKVQVAEDVAALSTADNVQLGWIDFAADGTYTLQLNEEGKARANALNNGETLQVKADYTAENSGVPSQTDVATLTITINGVDDAFIARDDVDSFTETAVEGGIEVAGNINVLTTAPGVDGPDPDTTDNPIKVQVAEDVAALSTADNVQLGWIDFAADGTYTLQLNEEGKARANALNNGETLQVKADYTAENSGVPSQTDVATLTITINGVDDAFIARDDVDSFTETAVEGGIEVAGNINVLTTAPGVDGPDPDTTDNPIKVQVAEDVAALSTADNVQLGWIDFAADGTYTLQLNEEGKARANALNNGETLQVKADYTAENSGVPSQTDVATLTITINGVDDAFIARDDVDSFTETAVEGGIEVAGNINVLTTAPGVDGPDPDTTDNPIKVQVAEDVAALSTADNVQLGWIDFAADGTYTLQLNEEGKARANALNNGETLQVKADYTAENSGVPSQTDVATLTITINGVDDAFIARDDVDSFTETAVEGGIEVAGNINVLTTAPGVDGPDPDTTDNPIKVQVAEDVAALSTADNVQLGWIDFAADGTYTLQLNEEGKARANALNNGETLQVKADYTAENSGVPSQTDVATLTITINGENDQPTIGINVVENEVYESYLPGGTDEIEPDPIDTPLTASGTITLSDSDGPDDKVQIRIGGALANGGSLGSNVVTLAELEGLEAGLVSTIPLSNAAGVEYGDLVLNSYDSNTGVIEWTYTLDTVVDNDLQAEIDNLAEDTLDRTYITVEISDDAGSTWSDPETGAITVYDDNPLFMADGTIVVSAPDNSTHNSEDIINWKVGADGFARVTSDSGSVVITSADGVEPVVIELQDTEGNLVATLTLNANGTDSLVVEDRDPLITDVALTTAGAVEAGGPGIYELTDELSGLVTMVTGSDLVNPSTQGWAIDDNQLDPQEDITFAFSGPVVQTFQFDVVGFTGGQQANNEASLIVTVNFLDDQGDPGSTSIPVTLTGLTGFTFDTEDYPALDGMSITSVNVLSNEPDKGDGFRLNNVIAGATETELPEDLNFQFTLELFDGDEDSTTQDFDITLRGSEDGVISVTNTAPITIDLDRDGVEYVGRDAGIVFTDQVSGEAVSTAWVAPDDGLLVIDADNSGTVNEAKEYIFTEWSETANTDMEAVAEVFDTNQDGVLDANDEQFDQFAVWQDADSDGVTDEGELTSLVDLGVDSIALTYAEDSESGTAADGDVLIHGQSTVTFTDGSTSTAEDTSFAQESIDLRDLLSGEEAADDLSAYLNVSFDGESTIVEVSASGSFQGNAGDATLVDQTITLEGVDLVGGMDDVNSVIQSMLDTGKLTIDS